MNDFDIALDFTLRWEGFVSDDPNDEGGMTIFGISKRSHPKAVMGMHQLILEGKKEEAFQIAKKIYYENYWVGSGCDDIDWPKSIFSYLIWQ